MKEIRIAMFWYCALAAILSTASLLAHAGTPLIDLKFRAGSGANSAISELGVQPNGRILAAGSFESFDGVRRTNLVRLHENGRVDRSFEAEFSFPGTYSIAIQPDRRILIGGGYGLYRLTTRGRLDRTFDASLYSSELSTVNAVVVQPDGRILVAEYGSASFTAGQPLVRLNPDGLVDLTFDFHTDQYRIGYCILLRPDGKIFIGGNFHDVNRLGQPKLALVNTDGSLDTSFRPEVGPTSGPYVAPYDIKLQPDGKILIAGNFYLVGREYRGNIGRLNEDGSLDSSFNPFPGTSNGFDGAVNSIALQDDGRIIVGGAFTSYNGVPRNFLARLDPDGALDESFNAASGPSGPLSKVLLLPNNRLLIAGAFDSFDGIPQGNISRLLLVDPEDDRRKPLRFGEK
jgi:uncharacterized delta-60 repeat protein